jgi:hypothetical protein
VGGLPLEEQQDERVREAQREEFLIGIARDLQSSGILPEARLALREGRVRLATRSYFVLNEAYHRWRIEEGHYTQPPKIAALQSLCIMRIEPFRLIEPGNALTTAEARPNEIYAVAVASAILGIPINKQGQEKTDQWLRILDLWSSYTCESIESIIQDAEYQISRNRTDYRINILDVDMPRINSLVTIFELLLENSVLRSRRSRRASAKGTSAPL